MSQQAWAQDAWESDESNQLNRYHGGITGHRGQHVIPGTYPTGLPKHQPSSMVYTEADITFHDSLWHMLVILT